MHDPRFVECTFFIFGSSAHYMAFLLSLCTLTLPLCFFAFRQYAGKEAEIVAQAGRKYAITISTNMAGRGTDIILGGNPKVGVLVR
jgi:hypothetical protein